MRRHTRLQPAVHCPRVRRPLGSADPLAAFPPFHSHIPIDVEEITPQRQQRSESHVFHWPPPIISTRSRDREGHGDALRRGELFRSIAPPSAAREALAA